MQIPFDNSFARDMPASTYARVAPTPVADPKLRAWNGPLAAQLGLDTDSDDDRAAIFAGNHLPQGADPIATLYAGHQFGHWNPQLGDGRAVLLGEVLDQDGARWDIQLKGSGRTPYSRNGDGRNWVGPALREYLVSEAMAALNIPTTRALAVVTTGERVQRETALPGAVVTRIATSHIRVGSFQVLAARGMITELETLATHTMARHFPQAKTLSDMLTQAVTRQANLVAAWMGVGFIHGVMNTDNAHVGGITIDYGPCAFMDDYHPAQVFSSIDHTGRYAYSNQANIAAWNMAQLATALLPLMPDRDAAIEEFTEIVNGFARDYKVAWRRVFGAKLGLHSLDETGVDLVTDLLQLMAENKADFTNTFKALERDPEVNSALQNDPGAGWIARWKARSPDTELMARSNPAVIPRNHLVEAAIQAAVAQDWSVFDALHRGLQTPFQTPDDPKFTQPPKPEEVVHQTFCGT